MSARIEEIQATIDALLTRFEPKVDTKRALVQPGALENAIEPLLKSLPVTDHPWLVAVDANTWRVAGERLGELLDEAKVVWKRWDVPLVEGETEPFCDDARVLACEEALRLMGASAGVAVGSGTINDVVKLAAYRVGVPMACVATAPSMNGFTSGIAAVLSEGVKTTVPCTAPRLVIADLDILAESPMRMIQSGLGDLLSKPVSNSDWALSAYLIGSVHSKEALEVIERGSDMLNDVAPKLLARDREALAGLTGSLILSGIAMSVAGSSSPASGGEHLISHYIDMTGHAFDLPCDFHGCQVGVGTLTTAYLYEKFRALDPSSIDVEARVAALVPWEGYEESLRAHFGPLFEAVAKHAKAGYPSPEVLRERLTKVREGWSVILQSISPGLRTSQSLEDELLEAGCPTRYAQLSVDKDRALSAIVHSKDIRNRYTILHLAWELGLLEAWADEAIARFYV